MLNKPKGLNPHSLKVIQVEQLSLETNASMGYATAFFCSYRDNIYLVTNHHVVSGRYPGTQEILHSSGAIPGSLRFDFSIHKTVSGDRFKLITCYTSIKLYDGLEPLWLEHPDLGDICDVVVIPLPHEIRKQIPPDASLVTIELERELDYQLTIGVMDELFITGFPLIKEKTFSKYPIYKAGFLASEPEDPQNGSQFYVDSKTKRGMSGSPIIQRERAKATKNDNGSVTITEGRINFVGIYSGRVGAINSDEYQAELGVAWPFRDFLLPIIEVHQSQ